MNPSRERTVRIEAIRIPAYRTSAGNCAKLAASIHDDGLRRPITLWSDGTVISGHRRIVAHLLLGKDRIPAVFVDTIEDTAARIKADLDDNFLAEPWKWSEVCRLWQVLRMLDEPAARIRKDLARRRGVELRRQTQAGKRRPGRADTRPTDYTLSVISAPFDISTATASRIEAIYRAANGLVETSTEKQDLARELMADLDRTGNVYGNYQRLLGVRTVPVARPKPVVAVEPAPAARQTQAWDRSLPQMEGLVAGLAELGPPNPELTWDQVGPVHDRLARVRRELEKMIRQMKETKKS